MTSRRAQETDSFPTLSRRHRSPAKDQRYRRRQKLGEVVWRIVGQEIPAAEYLIISTGRLNEAETLQRGKAEVALGRVLAALFQRWRNQLLSGYGSAPKILPRQEGYRCKGAGST